MHYHSCKLFQAWEITAATTIQIQPNNYKLFLISFHFIITLIVCYGQMCIRCCGCLKSRWWQPYGQSTGHHTITPVLHNAWHAAITHTYFNSISFTLFLSGQLPQNVHISHTCANSLSATLTITLQNHNYHGILATSLNFLLVHVSVHLSLLKIIPLTCYISSMLNYFNYSFALQVRNLLLDSSIFLTLALSTRKTLL